jgi:peptide/nickel transport system ATP-binding protein
VTGGSLLDIRDLTVEFGRGGGVLRAVDGVNLSVAAGQTTALVGESGSGKSTIARAVVGLVPAVSGSVTFDGQDITHAGRRQRRRLSPLLQMVFQDPYSSLNPARTVGDALTEPLLAQRHIRRADRGALVAAALRRVGLPAEAAHRYPAHFSGGQRQLVAIARALVNSPRMVICDEPVTALDLSIQAQVINLLTELQTQLDLSYLFITHDLAVMRHLAQQVVVLYRGQVVEAGATATVCSRPAHPYTRSLLMAAPPLDPARARAVAAARLVSAPAAARPALPDTGCRFAPRCPLAIAACTRVRPALVESVQHTATACIRHREISPLDIPLI